MTEIEETLNKIKTHKSILGIAIINSNGNIIRTTYTGENKEYGEKLAKSIPELVFKTKITMLELQKARECVKDVKDLKEPDELQFLRLKTKPYEIMVAPGDNYMLIVIQGNSMDKDKDKDKKDDDN